MSTLKTVFVCGNYSRNAKGAQANVIELLANIRAGQKACLDLLRKGYAPFCPWLDYMYCLLDDLPVTEQQFKDLSLAWLEKSDAIYVISGEGLGGGVDIEIRRAKELGIPRMD